MDLQDGKRMFGDLKSKLGFGGKNKDEAYDEEYFEEEYDDFDEEYEDYGEYGYDKGYDNSYDNRPARSSRDTYTTRPSYSSSRSGGVSAPRLVSIDDVRANTQVPSSLNRDPLPTRHVTPASSMRGGRTLVDASVPHQLTPEGSAAQVAASRRRSSEGLDSLFEPTTETPARPQSSLTSDPAITTRAAYDPYENYSGSSTIGYSSSRSVVVVKPMSYGDVERVSRSLKIGDAVVLALATTPDDLSKRVLDFSFGVASALDANVDCIADKVFVITRGKELTDAERFSLRSQGVL